MNKLATTTESTTDLGSTPVSTTTMSGDVQHPKYLDKEYIIRAREAEVKHHLHSISELQKKMERLASELAWELEQHHSKIHELYQLEMPFRKSSETAPGKSKTNKKSTTRQKNKQTFDIPLLGESLCESFA